MTSYRRKIDVVPLGGIDIVSVLSVDVMGLLIDTYLKVICAIRVACSALLFSSNFCKLHATVITIWIKVWILIYFNIVQPLNMQNGDEGLQSIFLPGQGILVKMLITLELHGIF